MPRQKLGIGPGLRVRLRHAKHGAKEECLRDCPSCVRLYEEGGGRVCCARQPTSSYLFFPIVKIVRRTVACCGVLQILGDGTTHVLTEKGVVPAQLRMPEVEGEFMDVCDIDTGLCTDAPQETAELLPDNSGKADKVWDVLLRVCARRLALRIDCLA